MNKKPDNNIKKQWAKHLYIYDNLTQKEIAAKVGITEKTLSKWVNDPKENWEMLKSSLTITKAQELKRLYIQLAEINNFIAGKEPGKRYANTLEADIISKLSAAIKNLETETSVSDTIDACIDINKWLKSVDFAKAQEFVHIQDEFIKHKLSLVK